MRRHGIGTLLTERRISALAGAANEVWCLANLWNRASVALHQRLGFELLTCDFEIPGVTFAGGQGGLFRRALATA